MLKINTQNRNIKSKINWKLPDYFKKYEQHFDMKILSRKYPHHHTPRSTVLTNRSSWWEAQPELKSIYSKVHSHTSCSLVTESTLVHPKLHGCWPRKQGTINIRAQSTVKKSTIMTPQFRRGWCIHMKGLYWKKDRLDSVVSGNQKTSTSSSLLLNIAIDKMEQTTICTTSTVNTTAVLSAHLCDRQDVVQTMVQPWKLPAKECEPCKHTRENSESRPPRSDSTPSRWTHRG